MGIRTETRLPSREEALRFVRGLSTWGGRTCRPGSTVGHGLAPASGQMAVGLG